MNDYSGEDGGYSGGFEGGSIMMPRKKGPWTGLEDEILAEYVRSHGEGNWNAVQRNTGLARCGKSCRLRWANHLRPNLKKGSFSSEEERTIVELHAKYGNKWARMASELPGRTDNEIKNYWNTRVKRLQRLDLPLYPPDIQPTYQTCQQSSSMVYQPQLICYQPQQQQQQQQQQSSSSYQSQKQHFTHTSSPISTPTTPSSSFTFQTPGNTCHAPSPSPSPSPSPHSTPPSPSLSSPHHCSTNPFFTTTSTNDNNQNHFSFPRSPPHLETPPRFKRINHDNITYSYNNPNPNPNSHSLPARYSLTFSPLRDCFSTSVLAQPMSCPTLSPFQTHSFPVNPPIFDTGTPLPYPSLRFDSFPHQQQMLSPTGSVYSMKPELPSNQFSSQNSYSVMSYDTKLINSENRKKRTFGLHSYSSGYLEDLIEGAKVMANDSNCQGLTKKQAVDKHEEKPGGFDQWCPSNDIGSSHELKPNDEGTLTMHEDLTKLMNDMPSTIEVSGWCMDNGEVSNGQSSVVTDDNFGLDMQQIATFFTDDNETDNCNNTNTNTNTNTNSCSWDNLPDFC